MNFKEKYHFAKLELLSPVHIGTGESLDPFSYVITDDNESGKSYLHYIDLPAFVENYRNPEELTRKFQGEFHSVRSFIAQTPEILKYSKSRAEVVSKKISAEYRQKLNDPRNQLKISPSLKNGDNNSLLIPGSSIKGAIRTAIIDFLDTKYQLALKGSGNKYIEKLETVFGKISDSIFKNLKIGDFEALPDSSCFVEAKELGKKADRKMSTPKDPCEVMPGLCMGDGTTIYGKMGLGCFTAKNPQDINFTIKNGVISESWTMQGLMDLCTEFYRIRFVKEMADFYEKPHLAKSKQALKKIEPLVMSRKPGEMLLRVGHYSHVECMTITNNAPQTRKTKDGQWMPYGTTRTLADGIYPFGWVKLIICDEGEYRKALDERCSATATLSYQSGPVFAPPTPPKSEIIQDILKAAILGFDPGKGMLSAIGQDGKKVESRDRNLVTEDVIVRIRKGKIVKADVTIAKEGNSRTMVAVTVL